MPPLLQLTTVLVVIVSLLPDITLAALRKSKRAFADFVERKTGKTYWINQNDYDNKAYVNDDDGVKI